MSVREFKAFQLTDLYRNLLEHVGENNIGCLWTAFYEGGLAMQEMNKEELVKMLRSTAAICQDESVVKCMMEKIELLTAPPPQPTVLLVDATEEQLKE